MSIFWSTSRWVNTVSIPSPSRIITTAEAVKIEPTTRTCREVRHLSTTR